MLLQSGYTDDIIKDEGTKQLIQTLTQGHFSGSSKALNKSQIDGLRTELMTTIRRFAWAQDLDPDSITMNTYEFNKGAYSEGKLDVSIKFPKVHNRRQIRSEIKNYLQIMHIGDWGNNEEKYIKPILETVDFTFDPEKKEVVFHVSSKVVKQCCDEYLKEKYKEFFPFFEDGQNIMLFSEFINNLLNSYKLQLRNYGEKILDPVQLKDSPFYTDVMHQVMKEGQARKQYLQAADTIKKVKFGL